MILTTRDVNEGHKLHEHVKDESISLHVGRIHAERQFIEITYLFSYLVDSIQAVRAFNVCGECAIRLNLPNLVAACTSHGCLTKGYVLRRKISRDLTTHNMTFQILSLQEVKRRKPTF